MRVSAPGVQRARSHPVDGRAWSELGYEDVSPKFWKTLMYNGVLYVVLYGVVCCVILTVVQSVKRCYTLCCTRRYTERVNG